PLVTPPPLADESPAERGDQDDRAGDDERVEDDHAFEPEEVRRVAEQPAEASALVRADGEGVRVRRQLELDVGRRRESGGVAARLLLRGQGVLRVREPDLQLDSLRARHRAAVERLLVDGDGALERADRARLLRERLLEILRRDLLRDELAERAEPADRR